MAEIVVMPKMNLIMENGILGQWYKSVGDIAAEGDPLCSVENEKETADVTAMAAGTVLKIWGAEGESYPVAAPLALLGAPDEDITEIVNRTEGRLAGTAGPEPAEVNAAPGALAAQPAPSDIKMLPKLRRMIRDKGIDINELITFCGKTRITEQDISDYEAARAPLGAAAAVGRAEKASGMRRAIAANMMESVGKTALLTNITEADMTACLKQRDSAKQHGRNISITALVIKACAIALKEHEILNASMDGDELIYHEDINIACAIDIPGGLAVPVIYGADRLDIDTISRAVAGFMERGQQGALTNADMAGGTFTVSNVGMFGVLAFTPIINYPQAAVMGIGAISRLPRYADGQSEILAPKYIMNLCLSYDHRIVDGAPAARFAARVRDILQDCTDLY